MSTITFAVITENDESSWNDITGVQYHFPKRYLRFLTAGTQIIYYKGKIKTKGFENQRLSNDPHYFGTAEIDYIKPDKSSLKGDYFALLNNYRAFNVPIPINNGQGYFETIPQNQANNYWRNGVRPITKEIFFKILQHANLDEIESPPGAEFETAYTDGERKVRYGTYYERNRRLREKAIEIHGLSCQACEF